MTVSGGPLKAVSTPLPLVGPFRVYTDRSESRPRCFPNSRLDPRLRRLAQSSPSSTVPTSRSVATSFTRRVPPEGGWDWLWSSIARVSLFISRPGNFVPDSVPVESSALFGVATDQLDGLNKLGIGTRFYIGECRSMCVEENTNEFRWLGRQYVDQVSRFHPSKVTSGPSP